MHTGLNRSFAKIFLPLAIPIFIQQLIQSSLGWVDVAFVGQLGEAEVAAVGIGNQVFFVIMLLLWGISSGSAALTAQYWGNKEIASIHRVMSIGLKLGTGSAILIAAFAMFSPQIIAQVYTDDSRVIHYASQYLRIAAPGYIAFSIALIYSGTLRSTGYVRPTVTAALVAVVTNTIFGYLLIFGNFGFPRLGVPGAAIGNVSSRFIECGLLLLFTYRRRLPAAIPLATALKLDLTLLKPYIKVAAPVIIGEPLWGIGNTTYSAIYGHISTEALAAYNICMSVESVAIVVFSSMMHASLIMIGNEIGAGNLQNAYEWAVRFLKVGLMSAFVVGVLVFTLRTPILSLYNISGVTAQLASNILAIQSFTLLFKASNMLLIAGILRGGGDTRFAALIDVGSMWLIGVPLAFLGASVFHFPVYWVFLMVQLDEITKCVIFLFRLRSKRWIHQISLKPAHPG